VLDENDDDSDLNIFSEGEGYYDKYNSSESQNDPTGLKNSSATAIAAETKSAFTLFGGKFSFGKSMN